MVEQSGAQALKMSREDKLELIQLYEEKLRRKKERKILSYYPDEGPLRRELYKKHIEFFEGGNKYRERLMLAANRVGKTEGVGGYEVTMHLTGLYPDWWRGKRFTRPISAWAAGDTGKTVREIIQFKLLGPYNDMGTGLIPKDCIVKTTPKQGIPEAIDTIHVKHVSGGVSTLVLKSYDQKRISFQGTEQDVIWCDEEPDMGIYTECLLRTMDTSGTGKNNGMILVTFTPLMGMSETVLAFLPNGEVLENQTGSKLVVMATWDDCPHLTETVKKELWDSIPPFQRDARSKGVPQLGSGAIYPIPESEIFVPDFPIPEHWPRAYALDVGWNRTAAIWGALDRETDTVYFYSEHYRGQAEPVIHAQAINARGEWIPGVIDPAARGRGQKDGLQLMQAYIDLGLDLDVAFNGVESGIFEVWQRFSSGRLKVFNSLGNFKTEFRLYRRDEKGQIVKANDHLQDCCRYFCLSGLERAKTKPVDKKPETRLYSVGSQGTSWMG
jgi:phage terminase large subunit-like protein